jgi:SAM-dependent methyltransferase
MHVVEVTLRPFTLPRLALALGIALVAFGCQHPNPHPNPTPPTAPALTSSSVRPGINDPYLDPQLDPQTWVERFEREGREIYDHRHEIVRSLQLEPGQKVADIGAGSGLFTALIASEVGRSGRVYAVDIVPAFIELIQSRAHQAGLTQVQAVLGTQRSVELPPHSIDVAFICDTYHHFEYPIDSLASISRALRSGGSLFVIDFHRIPGTSSEWILNHVRAGQETFTAEIEAAGFQKVEEFPFLRDNYFLHFRQTR